MNVLSSVLEPGDIIAIVSSAFAFAGLVFTAVQLWRKKRGDEARLISEI